MRLHGTETVERAETVSIDLLGSFLLEWRRLKAGRRVGDWACKTVRIGLDVIQYQLPVRTDNHEPWRNEKRVLGHQHELYIVVLCGMILHRSL